MLLVNVSLLSRQVCQDLRRIPATVFLKLFALRASNRRITSLPHDEATFLIEDRESDFHSHVRETHSHGFENRFLGNGTTTGAERRGGGKRRWKRILRSDIGRGLTCDGTCDRGASIFMADI